MIAVNFENGTAKYRIVESYFMSSFKYLVLYGMGLGLAITTNFKIYMRRFAQNFPNN